MADGVETPGGWAAALSLRFARRGERTVLAHREHRGPLVVQRPFYPEGEGCCHGVLLHPPGGVVGGDRLRCEATLGEGAHALLTTPAATKLYRSAGPRAVLENMLHVADGAALEWLPQETIAFAGTHARLSTRVELAPHARFIGWEVLCLGRPASGEAFARGDVVQGIELYRGGRPLLVERTHLAGGAALLEAPWGLGGRPVLGTLLAAGLSGSPGAGLELHRLEPPTDGLAGVTDVNGVLVARCLAMQAEPARHWLRRVWAALRPALTGRAACPPRIWNT